MTGRGVIPLNKFPGNVKINSDYYIDEVLKPLLEEKVAELCPGETDKVFVHHDAASSHTSRKTTQYAADLKFKLGMTTIPKTQMPVKSPDTSPMDFFGLGLLKQKLHLRRASTFEGVWNDLQRVWSAVTPEEVEKVYNS